VGVCSAVAGAGAGAGLDVSGRPAVCVERRAAPPCWGGGGRGVAEGSRAWVGWGGGGIGFCWSAARAGGLGQCSPAGSGVKWGALQVRGVEVGEA